MVCGACEQFDEASVEALKGVRLLLPASPQGCGPPVVVPPSQQPFALVVLRGNCTFVEKAAVAAASGASAVIVANSVEALYKDGLNTTSCDYDCTVGAAWVQVGSCGGLMT